MSEKFKVGDWCWYDRQATACRVIESQEMWGTTTYRIWLATQDAVVRAREQDLTELAQIQPKVEQILHSAAAAKLLDALEDNLLLAPIQSSVVPLPHQLYALNRAMSRDRIRYLLADEVGLGKTIEAGLILRELKLRGMVRRVLVVAPKGLVRQWQAEMRLHFGEYLRFIEASDLTAFRAWRDDTNLGEDSIWRAHDQVICSLDSVKPVERRRGWSVEQLTNHNRERFEDLVSAGWDLVIIDETHRLGGSTDQVARYKLGAALAESAPYLLLLSATPHQGKSDQFLRLMQLLDSDSFPDESSIHQNRVQPFVIRTEKRSAIDAEGQALFKPRSTRLHAVSWKSKHAAQQQLYEAVTDYVRHGYNQAMAAKQRHIGFLMILMQRLVTSSTAAIRATLEKRQALLDTPEMQAGLFDSTDSVEWAELDGQSQLDAALNSSSWEQEKSEVDMLLKLAHETEQQGTDAKAEALLELIYKLQQEENDPELKLLVFTEFVPTQTMLAEFLESRGFSVALLNGRMDLEARTNAQKVFSEDVRILISTDAGGEGLNLQFCHVIVNYDMPWNPMRLEQRIGRVDRIGQPHIVRAINFVLADTVEYRVRDVLDQKLALIAEEFGVNKAADVMDSVEVEPLFDELFVQSLQDPSSIEQECEEVIDQVRDKVTADHTNNDLLTTDHSLEADDARKWRDHPAQFWLERAITNGLPGRGGSAVQHGNTWQITWMDGSKSPRTCFDARTAEQNPELEWVTLEDPRARAVISDLSRFVAGQPVPLVTVSGLPDTIHGVWSLWEISLSAGSSFSQFNRKRYLPVFIMDDGRSFVPTAKRIWDLLLTEHVQIEQISDSEQAKEWFEASSKAAQTQGEQLFNTLVEEHRSWLAEERDRAIYSFESRQKAIGRLGLPEVREHRRQRLQAEHEARMAELRNAENCLPDMNALLLLRVGQSGSPV